jgi:hypothetical protein
MKYVSAFLMLVVGLICMTGAFVSSVFPAPGDPAPMHLMVGAVVAFIIGAVRVRLED